jgi:hypothetical protein
MFKLTRLLAAGAASLVIASTLPAPLRTWRATPPASRANCWK